MTDNDSQLINETAGSICSRNIPTAKPHQSIAEVRKSLHEQGKNLDTFNYIYVVDDNYGLAGVLSLKQIFTYQAASEVSEVMQRKVFSVDYDTDQEHAAMLALKHKLKSLPVVDGDGKLLGAIQPHVILKILHDEHVEDLLKEAGVTQRSLSGKGGISSQIKQRLPWLVIGTLGGVAAAAIVRVFETALAEELLLAAFIPAIVYLADATGTQVQTIYVRAYAFGLSSRLHSSLTREIAITGVIGAVVSGLLSLIVLIWLQQAVLAVIIALASFISIVFSGVFSVILPWLFIRLRYDPAVATGPLGTIVRDIGSIVIYFLVAQFMLGIL